MEGVVEALGGNGTGHRSGYDRKLERAEMVVLGARLDLSKKVTRSETTNLWTTRGHGDSGTFCK
jgi:hypothetical protein